MTEAATAGAATRLAKPDIRPKRPYFSSGPCAKRPGWTPEVLLDAAVGRSHRSKLGKKKIVEAVDRTRVLLGIPADYRIAIVPAGYADGLDLRLAGRGAVLVRGRRALIVGSVCMDMLMADVTGLDVSPGDDVVIIGSQKTPGGDEDRIDVREMAAAIGTIPYEILCRIGSRIERVYA